MTRGVLSRIGVLSLCAGYCWLFNWSYANIETELFAYQGFLFFAPATELIGLGYVAALVPVLWMPLSLRKSSYLGYWLLYGSFLVPTMFVPFYVLRAPPSEVVALVLVILANFGLLGVILVLPGSVGVPTVKIPRGVFATILMVGVLGLSGVVILTPGFELDLSLIDVYTRRFAARESVQTGSLRAYGIAWLGSSLAPLAISYGLAWRRYLFAAMGTGALLAVFALTGAKSALATPIFLLLVFAVVRGYRRRMGFIVMTGFVLLVIASSELYLVTGNPILSGSITRRIIASKGMRTAQYWETYRRDPVLMKDSGLMRMLGLPKEEGKSFVVGKRWGVAAGENANANAWAANFANFGYLGMFLATLFAGIVLRTMDGLAVRGNFEISAMMGALFCVMLGERAWETTILNGGVAATLLLMYLLVGASDLSSQSRGRRSPVDGVVVAEPGSAQ